jgi:hypothetical protein
MLPPNIGRISGPLLKDNLLRDGTDLRFEDQLLYLDVTSKKLSINSTPINKELFVNGTLRTDAITIDAPKIAVGTLEIGPNNVIRSTNSGITVSGSDYVLTHGIRTDNLEATGQSISSYTTNTNIEIRPTGSLEIYANTNVTGNLHATGNITADESVIFGSDAADSVTFSADVNSNVIPDITNTYSLGESGKQWNDFRFKSYTGNILYTNNIIISNLTLTVSPRNEWFVATLGLDTNQGINESGAFATIRKALSMANPGDTVHIFPGTYTEIFPLTVPQGVTVKGHGTRSVTVQPTAGTNTNNAFLLNGETAVADLTVANFYQGYAFSFAQGAKTTTRSPYIQNVSVITSGVNAGKGALVDGSVCDAATFEAAMLFHSVTFITPGVDALTMTNGVRVEWLNSFTYFANRSLYATQGSLGLASLGVKFGAEVRAIASASVYGTYGAVADGASTLMYLIQYNFGYVGSGLDSNNDRTLVIQANEAVELNNGKIYYQSVDQQGNFRVGDQFYVDFDKGTTSINISAGAVNGISSLTIGADPNKTFIDYSKVDIGDFTIRDNTILTKSKTFNIVSATGQANLTQNVSIAKDLSVTGDVNIKGTITVGNQPADAVSFTADINSDIIPSLTKTYTLGSDAKRWLSLTVNESYVNNVKVSSNSISILPADTNLQLNATGKIVVPTNNVGLSQTLRVNGATSLANTTVVGDVIHTGAYNQTGNRSITGNASATVSGKLSDITFSGDTIHSDTSVNLVLPTGLGKLNIASSNSDISIKNSRIINNKNDPIVFSTNNGYVKFAGTGAMAIPVGTQNQRPVAPETGTLRTNSTSGNTEVYTQPTNTWNDITGLGDIATREVVEEYGNLWILILG